LREGLASIDSAVRYLGAYKPLVSALETATNLAKRERAGQYEFGDVSED
jgi:staphylococcal nuclease domain-containing protein 1